MSTLVPGDHPLLAYADDERRAYLTIVATMALADGVVDDAERERLDDLCKAFELGDNAVDAIIAEAKTKDVSDELFESLRGSELRFSLLVDLVDLAVGADGDIGPEEEAELVLFADALDITTGQVAMTRRFVMDRRLNEDAKPDPDTLAGLAGVGVPVAALAVMAPLGAPIAVGLGLAAALGVGSFVSVRWLARRIRGKAAGDAPELNDDGAP